MAPRAHSCSLSLSYLQHAKRESAWGRGKERDAEKCGKKMAAPLEEESTARIFLGESARSSEQFDDDFNFAEPCTLLLACMGWTSCGSRGARVPDCSIRVMILPWRSRLLPPFAEYLSIRDIPCHLTQVSRSPAVPAASFANTRHTDYGRYSPDFIEPNSL
jgi:hypothetical protein